MVEVVNRQRRKRMALKPWQTFADAALEAIGRDGYTATIAFVSDRQIQELNHRFRGLAKPTDVLSFPAESVDHAGNASLHLGDIAVSIERAVSQARESGLEFDKEVAQLILHGLLHLCGYDHETDNGEMNRLELRLRRRLRI